MSGIKSQWIAGKANAFPAVLLLWPLITFFSITVISILFILNANIVFSFSLTMDHTHCDPFLEIKKTEKKEKKKMKKKKKKSISRVKHWNDIY